MGAADHAGETPSDDEVWALAIAKCEKAERSYWTIALFFSAAGLVEVIIGWGSPAGLFALAIGFGAWALIIRLDVQYWRLIGYAPARSYWRRVADLSPQFVAVGVASAGSMVVIDALLRPATIEEVALALAMGAGAAIGFALGLGLSLCVSMKTARRWLT